MIVSTVMAGNLAACARWSLLLRASPACIFHDVSPPAWSSRRWWRGIWLRVPAGPCCCAPSRRAFFILFLRRHGRLDGSGEKFGCVCPLATAVARQAGVHFSSCFSAGMVVLTVAARNLAACARWPQPLRAKPACIFHPVSPPAWSS